MIRFCDKKIVRRDSDFDKSLNGEMLIWDEDIWENVRHLFGTHRLHSDRRCFLVPVVDRQLQLVCFAYEDNDANREIRQLRELMDEPDALQFSEIYSQYGRVVIYGFNELTVFFAKYLRTQKVPVQCMWEEESPICEECSDTEDHCLIIYAEGTWEKSLNWKENLLRSVSVEFECIDKIYETNMKAGIIKDAKEDAATLFKH